MEIGKLLRVMKIIISDEGKIRLYGAIVACHYEFEFYGACEPYAHTAHKYISTYVVSCGSCNPARAINKQRAIAFRYLFIKPI